MAITINGDGTLTGVSVGGLPDGIVDTDMLATDAVSAAKLQSTAIAAGDLPAGSILQVVQTVKTDTDSTSSTTISDIAGMSRSITPVASGSSLLIISDLSLANNSQGSTAVLDLYRDSTAIAQPDSGTWAATISHWANGSTAVWNRSFTFLDTPTYTLGNSLTYKWRWRVDNTSLTTWVNRHNGNANYSSVSQITVMEVAA